MIEFFEFMNTCSPLRAILYLIFIVVTTFILFVGIGDIIKNIVGETTNHHYYHNGDDVTDEEDNTNED
jgi:hypothetical protein